ncbi:hypothetical protein BH23BAC1_BH23BAC1_24690 [soil metagenome]
MKSKKIFFNSSLLQFTLILVFAVGLIVDSWAQQPRNIPPASDYQPFQVNTVLGIIIYIVFPIFIIVLYILWRRREKKRRENRK